MFDRSAGAASGSTVAHAVESGRMAVHLADPHRIAGTATAATPTVAIVVRRQLRVVVVVRTGRVRGRAQIRVRMVVWVHCY